MLITSCCAAICQQLQKVKLTWELLPTVKYQNHPSVIFHILSGNSQISLTPCHIELWSSMPHSQGLSSNPYQISCIIPINPISSLIPTLTFSYLWPALLEVSFLQVYLLGFRKHPYHLPFWLYALPIFGFQTSQISQNKSKYVRSVVNQHTQEWVQSLINLILPGLAH